MKNNVKKLFALALVVAMTMGLAVTAFAVQAATVTIAGNGEDGTVTGITAVPLVAGGRNVTFTKQANGTFMANFSVAGDYALDITIDENKGKLVDVRKDGTELGKVESGEHEGKYKLTAGTTGSLALTINTDFANFSAAGGGAGTVDYDVTNSVPVINVKVESAKAVVVNPYRLNYVSGDISGNKTIITKLGKIESRTPCPLEVTAKVTGTIDSATPESAAQFSDSSVKDVKNAKKVHLYLEMAESADDFLGSYESSGTQVNVAATEQTGNGMYTIDAYSGTTAQAQLPVGTEGVPDPAVAVFQLFGDCSTSDTWTSADKVGVTVALEFKALVNEPSAGTIHENDADGDAVGETIEVYQDEATTLENVLYIDTTDAITVPTGVTPTYKWTVTDGDTTAATENPASISKSGDNTQTATFTCDASTGVGTYIVTATVEVGETYSYSKSVKLVVKASAAYSVTRNGSSSTSSKIDKDASGTPWTEGSDEGSTINDLTLYLDSGSASNKITALTVVDGDTNPVEYEIVSGTVDATSGTQKVTIKIAAGAVAAGGTLDITITTDE